MSKQTARNNKMLAGIKRQMNEKIYKRCLKLMNPTPDARYACGYDPMSGGPDATRMYLQQFFNRVMTLEEMATAFDHLQGSKQ
jgi:hypothetical protein